MKLAPHTIYEILLKEFGNLNWWPMDKGYHEKNGSDPRYEIIVGAILTQNTAWSNVEKALTNLKSQNKLDINNISNIKIENLQELIRPSGFFKQKAKRLKDFTEYLKNNYQGNLDNFFDRDINTIREELLSLNGIGPETADSIILYAGSLSIFVVDAYTKRICKRLPLDTNISYEEIQQFFQKKLCKKYSSQDIPKVYNELHAQIVILAKNYCKKNPECDKCPLNKYCSYKN
ncbi:MAG: endonuclease [Thermoplasmatales archaeon]|nr:endonuclease [Thermoplasmatales archaeon]MCK4995394.1 endonuclease [Thermoplasmatales archaeon]